MLEANTLNGYLLSLLIAAIAGVCLLLARRIKYEMATFACWALVAFGWFLAACTFISRVHSPSQLNLIDILVLVILIPSFGFGVIKFGDKVNEIAAGMSHYNSD